MSNLLSKRDFEKTIANLSSHRPVFHSEADFQFAISQQLAADFPKSNIRLEKPINIGELDIYCDIFLENSLKSQIIELKYKTAKCDLKVNYERFPLKQQSANDTGSYDFFKDIERVEKSGYSGFACMLTNDATYWDIKRQYKSMYQNFRLTEGVVRTGALDWIRDDYINQEERLLRTIGKHRNRPIILKSRYLLNWKDYSEIGNQKFRYLLIEVPNI